LKCLHCGIENSSLRTYCGDCGSLVAGATFEKRYSVISRLGGGAMGAVYKVFDERLKRHQALKEISLIVRKERDRQEFLERFRRESHILSRLHHPGLPRVIDFFTTRGRQYLVMDLIAGDDLQTLLSRYPQGLPEAEVKDIGLQVLSVLEYLHGLNPPIVYRDLKPSNIMSRTNDGRIFLIDFGIAKLQYAVLGTGTSIGTEGYAPPEQYAGRSETRSDLYSLAATMHHLLTGVAPSVPFEFEPARYLKPTVSQHISDVLARALRFKPEDRYATASDMKAALVGNTAGARPTPNAASPAVSYYFTSHCLSTMPARRVEVAVPAASDAPAPARVAAVNLQPLLPPAPTRPMLPPPVPAALAPAPAPAPAAARPAYSAPLFIRDNEVPALEEPGRKLAHYMVVLAPVGAILLLVLAMTMISRLNH
jgi:serine/threonine-protein kinase